MTTRTQLRAICPVCFRQQAIRGISMVAHGYQRPEGWHQNVGDCNGVNEAHFGTEAGRDYAAARAASFRRQAEAVAQDAEAVRAGAAPVYKSVRENGKRVRVVVENPAPYQVREYAEQIDHQAAMIVRECEFIEGLVAAWAPVEPVAVAVESKVPPVHYHHGKAGKLCAGSMNTRWVGAMTTDRAAVTCSRCIARFPIVDRMAAKAAAAKAAG